MAKITVTRSTTIFDLTTDTGLITELIGYETTKADYVKNTSLSAVVSTMLDFADQQKNKQLLADLNRVFKNEIELLFNE